LVVTVIYVLLNCTVTSTVQHICNNVDHSSKRDKSFSKTSECSSVDVHYCRCKTVLHWKLQEVNGMVFTTIMSKECLNEGEKFHYMPCDI